jgi:hypothetical protein
VCHADVKCLRHAQAKTIVACGGTIFVYGGEVCVIHGGKTFVACEGTIFVCGG